MRNEINDLDLESVVGGKLIYKSGVIYDKNAPDNKYKYSDITAIANYLKNNWTGGAYDEKALKMLEAAGLIWK